MIWWIIISGWCFVIGNVVWTLLNEPKLFYVPLASFLLSLCIYVRKRVKENKLYSIFLTSLELLAYGNMVKQVFYSDYIKQVNDYVWGGLVAARLIYELIKYKLWETPKQISGRK